MSESKNEKQNPKNVKLHTLMIMYDERNIKVLHRTQRLKWLVCVINENKFRSCWMVDLISFLHWPCDFESDFDLHVNKGEKDF